MKKTTHLWIVASCAVIGLGAAGLAGAQQSGMSFFVTSTSLGNGLLYCFATN